MRQTTLVLAILLVAAAALIAATALGLAHTPVPIAVPVLVAAVCGPWLILRAVPPGGSRPTAFAIVFIYLALLIGGFSYFQFVLKPQFIKSFISTAFAPKPTTVAAEEAKVEQWPPLLDAIGTLRAYQGVVVAPQVAGVVSAIHFELGDDVAAGAPLVDLDTSVEEADLANGLAQLKNANVTLDRAKSLIASGNTPQSTVDAAIATRDSAAASVERTKALIAQKKIVAPFAGRLGLRTVDIGQYVAAGASLTTLQRLDPIYVDFSAPEGALATLATGQQTDVGVDSQPGRTFTGKVVAIDARVSADFAQCFGASRTRESRPQAASRNVRSSHGNHRRASRCPDAAAHRDRLQPLWRQYLRGRARARRQGADRSASLRPCRRSARRTHRHRRRREGGGQGGDRRPDQAAAQFPGRDRPRRRFAAAGRNAQTVTARA